MSLQSILHWQRMTMSDIVALGISFALAHVITLGVYRLYFHPLAKYPGPFWARLSSFPSYWHTLQRDRHVWLLQLQEKYGSTFRYRPDSVLINTPTAYRTLFGPKGNVKKGVYYEAWPRNVDALTTWNCVNIDVHGRKRRVLNYAFSDKAMRSAEPFILSNADRWCELIGQEASSSNDGSEWSPPLNMADWVNYLVFDILGDLCFGQSFDMKERDSAMRYVPHLLAEFLELMHPIAHSPFASFWVWAKPRGLDRLLKSAGPPALKNWEGFVEKCLADRTRVEEANMAAAVTGGAAGAGRKDFFHYLFHAVDPETGKRGYPLEELYGECEALTIAGADTTSIIMSAMFFYLARYPALQTKLAAEICAVFSGPDEIRSGPKLQACRYLRAFIQEALRMTPPVGAEPSREVLPGGTVVDGQFFPAGLHVSTGLYCLSYNGDVYPEPARFRPERWIVADGTGEADGASEESIALAELGFCAFSAGSRGCPGKNIAWLEMTIVMAKVVFQFEVKQDPTSNLGGGDAKGKVGRRVLDQYQTYDAFVSLRDGPMVQFRRRARA